MSRRSQKARLRAIAFPVRHTIPTIDEAIAAFRQRTRSTFQTFLTDPATGPRLDLMLADNAATDALLELERENEAHTAGGDGSACGPWCGGCGRCA